MCLSIFAYNQHQIDLSKENNEKALHFQVCNMNNLFNCGICIKGAQSISMVVYNTEVTN